MIKTSSTKIKDIKVAWHLIDAEGKILGRIASEIVALILGKNKSNYAPNLDCGDKVVVVNAEKIVVTGKKLTDKIYYRHSNYPAGLKSETLGDLLARRPEEALRRAVLGMLPKNKLQDERIKNLYIYKGPENPHKAQVGK
ncbi:50S ribosomal protein L13 [candidate division WWE3 bacterium CG_4_10_14_0_2_um_filter_42_7]|uniref:Large ribosomal subunit protein uL13 n=2 Tax=Katanobacteria TaxID=422282 RepID=A0A2H0X8M7_UNCKA|nr:MAG: 50S ribosomal protein L13 [candidate division WWE3 bacterium CG08_land_8_20_14_0_20_41_15]PIZ43828.1 MAG: 50S ribosomal protein L13 [candidate division WWE3 bacterium CG_4_10_14_0_2_um_filter_42_7]